MITEHLEEQACLYVLGDLSETEAAGFELEIGKNAALAALVRDLANTSEHLARLVPEVTPPAHLKSRVLEKIDEREQKAKPQLPVGLAFAKANDETGWKALPIPGAFLKLLSYEPKRGYAVLLGKLEPGVRYPAHINAGPEDFMILTGDLHVSGERLGPFDFHHADGGSMHEENFSVEGCTLIAVLTVDDPLVQFAMA